MNLLKHAVEFKAAQDAAAPKEQVSLWQRITRAYRSWKGKRALQALAKAKREEKAALAAQNEATADELDAAVDRLIHASVLCRKTDPTESDRLFEEAQELAAKAALLRCN
ncbi:hypothetical protein D3C81_1789360 [compost metagenome]